MGGKGSGGHNRKSIEQHLQNGTYKPCRHGVLPKSLKSAAKGRGRPKVFTPIPVPSYFDGYARNEWERVCKVLFDKGTLQDVNHATLEGYCSAYSTAVKATEKINKDGFTQQVPLYNKQGDEIGVMDKRRAEVDISIKAWAQVKMFAVELSITSSSGKSDIEPQTPLEKALNEALKR